MFKEKTKVVFRKRYIKKFKSLEKYGVGIVIKSNEKTTYVLWSENEIGQITTQMLRKK